jgi:type VI protein secretion system component VasF
MTLIELCEPLMQYMCRVNRSAHKGLPMDPAQVRADVRQMMQEIATKAQRAGMAENFEKTRKALHTFIDATVMGVGGLLGQQWKAMRLEPEGALQEFFAQVEAALGDPDDDATERLAVYYHCIGLGIAGQGPEDTEGLRRMMAKMQARLRGRMEVDPSARICPEAYESLNTANLIEPPARSMAPMAIALVGTVIVLAVANLLFFRHSSADLSTALQEISGSTRGGSAEKTGGRDAAAPAEAAPQQNSDKTTPDKTTPAPAPASEQK